MIRRLSFLAVALLVGCGGGPGAPSSLAPQTSSEALETVEECLAPDLVALSGFLERLEAIAAEGPEALLDSLVALKGIDAETGRLAVSLDLDLDGAADLDATFGFEDAAGDPLLPLSLLNFLLDESPDLFGFFGALPDGARFVLDYAFVGDATGSGSLVYRFEAGGLASASGSGTYSNRGCGFEFSFDADLPSDVASEFPVAEFDFSLDAGVETLAGRATLDGSSLATVVLQLPGEEEETYVIDLLTGEVS